jgi:hypothetical protein
LHKHNFPSYDSLTTDYYIPNDETTAFQTANGLHEIQTDTTGTSLLANNRQWNLFAFGTIGEDGNYSKVYINKSTGFYDNDLTNATNDANNTANYNYPAGFAGAAFPIARVTMQYNSGGNYTVLAITDLREGLEGGGGGGQGVSTFLGLTDTPSSYTGSENYNVKVNSTGTGLEFVPGGAGESNTASNAGTGQSIYKQKAGVDLEFYGLNSLSNIIEITLDGANSNVDYNINSSNLNAFISANSDVAANTAKVTNATHTGEVTGSVALTAQSTMISNKAVATLAGTEEVLVNSGGTLEKTTTQDIADLASGGGGVPDEIVVSYTTATGVDGGNTTQDAWTDYPINTTDSNSISGASRSGVEITLPAGDYELRDFYAYLSGGSRKIKLYNVSDASDIVFSNSSALGAMFFIDKFTLAASKVVKFQYYLTNDNITGTGLGSATGEGSPEIHGKCSIQKIG